MQIGMIGLGRMGSNMVRRLLKKGVDCVVFDAASSAVEALVAAKATAASSLEDLVGKLNRPRVLWMMVPAGAVDSVLKDVSPHLQQGDIVVDGGNSYYVDDIRRASDLAHMGLRYVDVGTSGGIWGLERGFCMMIGGDRDSVEYLKPVFAALAPGAGTIAQTPSRKSAGRTTAGEGYLYCGASGAGHFVKMVHNAIEYGMMAAYAEGFSLLRAANVGNETKQVDAETPPLRNPEHYRYNFDLADIAEVWRRGSVITSWLLDLTAIALSEDPALEHLEGRVSDSGEGRWAIQAGVDEGVPLPVISASLYGRFCSRGQAEFQNKLLSALRQQFGGHMEKR